MTNMITAVMIANRIWMMYCRNAVRLPIGIAPLSTRYAPSHSTATVLRFMISISAGSVIANSRLTRSAGLHEVQARRRRTAAPRAACGRRRG